MSDYIMELRKIVGHRPLLSPGAGVILEDAEGRVLLELRHEMVRTGMNARGNSKERI